LADTISSLPPRGSDERRLSTYWIDKTLERLRAFRAAGEDGPIASGNAYSVVLRGEEVVAVFDYGDEDQDEPMPVETSSTCSNAGECASRKSSRSRPERFPRRIGGTPGRSTYVPIPSSSARAPRR